MSDRHGIVPAAHDALANIVEEDRVIGAVRTPETRWRGWLQAQHPRPLPQAFRPGAPARLVVVAPHPDDEVLACGGLLSMHLDRGGELAVIGVTDGEASHPSYSPAAARCLGRDRRLERERGLRRLGLAPGAHAVSCLGLPDGQVAAHAAELRDALLDLLRPGDTVVSTWSLDGHPDHDTTGQQSADACAIKGCNFVAAPVWMWHWSRPGDPRVPWASLRALRLPGEVLERKGAALAEHASQLAPREELGPVLDPAIRLRAMRDTEYYFVA